VNVALYARVSTADQDCAMQLSELREYCSRRSWPIQKEYIDKGFGGRRVDRPEFLKLMADASRHRFDAVLVWKMDRFGRSLADLTQNIKSLKSYGVRWLSVSQALDTDDSNPASRLLMHVLGAIAEFESDLIRERVKAGLEQARRAGTKSGKAIGRPRRVFRKDEVLRLRAEGVSIREIARQLEIGQGTVMRTCAKTQSSDSR
jgi:putative DNA-invertase from lambdoid prophage Rac